MGVRVRASGGPPVPQALAGHYLWKTYKVACEEVLYVGSALRQLDPQPVSLHLVMTKTTPMDRVMPKDLDLYDKKKGERRRINHTIQVHKDLRSSERVEKAPQGAAKAAKAHARGAWARLDLFRQQIQVASSWAAGSSVAQWPQKWVQTNDGTNIQMAEVRFGSQLVKDHARYGYLAVPTRFNNFSLIVEFPNFLG
ncbi:hypothetical protein Taro_003299 [Colocasia esculenta]|uniref:Uncharacterized protein n=1 Tax=Colocasia esculenta TaxID=4460 RepID=A0A843TIZ2_COLES|nr:hypothetical protein [Colocasia esculenta]